MIQDRGGNRGSEVELKKIQKLLQRFTFDRSENTFLVTTKDKYWLKYLCKVEKGIGGSFVISAELAKLPLLDEK